MLDGARRLARLRRVDRRLALEAIWELARATLEIRFTASRDTVRLLGLIDRDGDEPAVPIPQLREARRVGNMVERAARHLPWHPTCLRQALAVKRMLRRRGIPCRLHLGVESASEGVAHAWVTVDDRPVVGRRGHERFVPLAAFG
jgi:Transglutaminase-like superfamily